MHERGKVNVKGALAPASDEAVEYVGDVFRMMYGVCCTLTVAVFMLGELSATNCDGQPNGMGN